MSKYYFSFEFTGDCHDEANVHIEKHVADDLFDVVCDINLDGDLPEPNRFSKYLVSTIRSENTSTRSDLKLHYLTLTYEMNVNTICDFIDFLSENVDPIYREYWVIDKATNSIIASDEYCVRTSHVVECFCMAVIDLWKLSNSVILDKYRSGCHLVVGDMHDKPSYSSDGIRYAFDIDFDGNDVFTHIRISHGYISEFYVDCTIDYRQIKPHFTEKNADSLDCIIETTEELVRYNVTLYRESRRYLMKTVEELWDFVAHCDEFTKSLQREYTLCDIRPHADKTFEHVTCDDIHDIIKRLTILVVEHHWLTVDDD
jgi:hypothetical protein